MLSGQILSRLERVVGRERIKSAPEDLISYSYDAYLEESLPGAVLFPQSTEEVSAILRLASSEKIPVTPRGAGTNLSGGSIPVPEGIVLCLTRMNRILEVDERNRLAVVEAGVINGDLQRAVEAKNLFYPPDPSSQYISTLGGNVAENAGGLKCLKYGTTRDYLLALEVVLASGEVIQTGSRTAKNVSGYDLTRLLCGSEGTLGVVTKITVRLLPKPEAKRALQAIFPDLGEAGETVARIMGAGITPSIMELMDQAITGAVEDFTHIGLPKDVEAVLLIEVDGKRKWQRARSLRSPSSVAKGAQVRSKSPVPRRRMSRSGWPGAPYLGPWPGYVPPPSPRIPRSPYPTCRPCCGNSRRSPRSTRFGSRWWPTRETATSIPASASTSETRRRWLGWSWPPTRSSPSL